jgi:hypothetical protein
MWCGWNVCGVAVLTGAPMVKTVGYNIGRADGALML